jgi:hypothetical protein
MVIQTLRQDEEFYGSWFSTNHSILNWSASPHRVKRVLCFWTMMPCRRRSMSNNWSSRSQSGLRSSLKKKEKYGHQDGADDFIIDKMQVFLALLEKKTKCRLHWKSPNANNTKSCWMAWVICFCTTVSISRLLTFFKDDIFPQFIFFSV